MQTISLTALVQLDFGYQTTVVARPYQQGDFDNSDKDNTLLIQAPNMRCLA